MPVHDWTRVDAGVFHSFHTLWIGQLAIALNDGLLPDSYYALGEQRATGMGPDVLTLQPTVEEDPERSSDEVSDPGEAIALLEAPPQVSLVVSAEQEAYSELQRVLVIRHSSDHHIVAMIEIISEGNKSNRHGIRKLMENVLTALRQGIHLLLIDLRPPGTRDPQGIHGLVWEEMTGEQYERPQDKPLTLAAYTGKPGLTAYIEPVAVGDSLIPMPLFLESGLYVNVPLEPTYETAYSGTPRYYRSRLEASD